MAKAPNPEPRGEVFAFSEWGLSRGPGSAMWFPRALERPGDQGTRGRMHISFLIHNAYGIGGTIRTTFNLAGTLAERHDVEIVSVLRHRDAPVFDLGPRVALRHLVDLRESGPSGDGADPAHARPAKVFPAAEGRYGQYSELTDRRIAQHLRRTEADVVVGTRPGLNVHIARQTRRGPVRVGQEHLTLDSHSRALKLALRGAYPRLDAVTTVTEADALAYRRTLRLPGVRVEAVPNSVPAPVCRPPTAAASGSSRPAGSPGSSATTCSYKPSRRSSPSAPTGGCGSTAAARRRPTCAP